MILLTTRDAIIKESLNLFSKDGYDAVSTRMIARAVNASDAVIYKHFSSKHEILETIIDICKKRFLNKRNSVSITDMRWNDVESICMDMFRFQTHDEWIVPFRRLLVIEQFKNPELSELYKALFIDAPVDSMTEMFNYLIREGHLKEGNPRVYAMELYAPFFMYHTIHLESEELLKDLEEHVVYFRKNYRTNGE